MTPADAERPVVLTIVYVGPTGAGTSTTFRSLASTLGEHVETAAPARDGPTLTWLEHTGGAFDGQRLRCQVVALGAHTGEPRCEAVLATADAVVAVLDASEPDPTVTSAWLAGLRRALDRGPRRPELVVQANKCDVAGAASEDELRATLDLGDAPLVETSARTGGGIRQAFVFAVRASVRSLRAPDSGERPARLDLAAEAGDAPGAATTRTEAPVDEPGARDHADHPDEQDEAPSAGHGVVAAAAAPPPRPFVVTAPADVSTWPPAVGVELLEAANADAELGHALLTAGTDVVRTERWLVRRTRGSSYEMIRRRFDELTGSLAPVRGVLSERAITVARDDGSGVLFEVVRRRRTLADGFASTMTDADPGRALTTLAAAAARVAELRATTSCPVLRISLSTVAEAAPDAWYVGLCERADDTRTDALTIGGAAQWLIDHHGKDAVVRALAARGLHDTARAWGLVEPASTGDAP